MGCGGGGTIGRGFCCAIGLRYGACPSMWVLTVFMSRVIVLVQVGHNERACQRVRQYCSIAS